MLEVLKVSASVLFLLPMWMWYMKLNRFLTSFFVLPVCAGRNNVSRHKHKQILNWTRKYIKLGTVLHAP